jgi:hypothetical protein
MHFMVYPSNVAYRPEYPELAESLERSVGRVPVVALAGTATADRPLQPGGFPAKNVKVPKNPLASEASQRETPPRRNGGRTTRTCELYNPCHNPLVRLEQQQLRMGCSLHRGLWKRRVINLY